MYFSTGNVGFVLRRATIDRESSALTMIYDDGGAKCFTIMDEQQNRSNAAPRLTTFKPSYG